MRAHMHMFERKLLSCKQERGEVEGEMLVVLRELCENCSLIVLGGYKGEKCDL